jgi:hypothetical protein
VPAQVEAVGELVQVRPHLVATGEEGVVGRHRSAVEARDVARRDEVKGLVVGVPVTADPVGALQRDDLVTGVAEDPERFQTGRTGADHAHPPAVVAVVPALGHLVPCPPASRSTRVRDESGTRAWCL